MSDFGIQLRAKQKLKGYYGDVTEKAVQADLPAGQPHEGRRLAEPDRPARAPLDMVVYRAKFAPTIWSARQLVSHGHIRVNGVKCNIASRRVNVGDVIELGSKAQEMALVMEAQASPSATSPITSRRTATKVSYSACPRSTKCPYPVKMDRTSSSSSTRAS
jgi:small subunit ribosomal protein S4